jgi:hypothetical protein
MLPYIQANYPEMKIIFLIRHPLATVLSRIRIGWNHLLDDFTRQPRFCKDFGDLLQNLKKNCDTDAEKHVHSWCLEHYVPLKRLHSGNLHVVYYEELLSDPLETYSKLFEFIDLEMDETLGDQVFRRSALSADAKDRPDINTGESMLSKEKVEDILRLYHLDFLYDSLGNPKTAAQSILQKLKG